MSCSTIEEEMEMKSDLNFPEDVLAFEVIPYLPLKQISQLKLLSHFFLESIESSFFDDILETVIPKVVCLCGLNSINLVKLNHEELNPVLKEAVYPQYRNHYFNCGFCQGVLLLASGGPNVKKVVIYNPSTEFYQNIHWCELYLKKFEEFYRIGLGFMEGRFKIIRLLGSPTSGLEVVSIYDSELEEWYDLDAVYKPKNHPSPFAFRSGCLVLCDSVCHWLLEPLNLHPKLPIIIRFDLQQEEWLTDVPLPPGFPELINSRLSDRFLFNLSIAEEKLVLTVSCSSPLIDVWVLSDYNVLDSWSLFRVNVSDFPSRLSPPVGFSVLTLGPKVLLMDRRSQKLYWYDINEQSASEMVVDSVRFLEGHVNKCTFRCLPW